MGIFKRRQPEEPISERVLQERTLDTVASVTDPLATKVVAIYEGLPQDQREDFMRRVLSGLVIQAFATQRPATVHIGAAVEKMQQDAWSLRGYGTQQCYIASDSLADAVVGDALNVALQPELEFPTEPVTSVS